MMKKGFITRTQISNLSKLMYDIGKLLVGGGIITPYLSNTEGEGISVGIFCIAGFFVALGLFFDSIYDRMG